VPPGTLAHDDADPKLPGISSRVTCVVDLSGDMDLTIPYPDPMWDKINAARLGGTPEEVPQAYRDASPLYQVDEQSAPFLVLQRPVGADLPRAAPASGAMSLTGR
jgi:hypothetical protein